MEIINVDTLKLEFTEFELAVLTGDPTGSVIDELEIQSAIDYAEEYVLSALRHRYWMGDEISNPLIIKICIDLAIAEIYFRAKKNSIIPETIILRKTEAKAILEKILKGEIEIEEEKKKVIFSNSQSNRIFNRNFLSQYFGIEYE